MVAVVDVYEVANRPKDVPYQLSEEREERLRPGLQDLQAQCEDFNSFIVSAFDYCL